MSIEQVLRTLLMSLKSKADVGVVVAQGTITEGGSNRLAEKPRRGGQISADQSTDSC